MDKQLLVSRLYDLINRLKETGTDVTDFRLIPAYRLLPSGPVTVGLVVPSLHSATRRSKVDQSVAWRFNWLDEETRGIISSMLIYTTAEEMNQDLDEREGVGRPVVEPYWPD